MECWTVDGRDLKRERETDSTVEVLTLPCTYSDTANANAIVLLELADETVDTVPWPMTIGVQIGRAHV